MLSPKLAKLDLTKRYLSLKKEELKLKYRNLYWAKYKHLNTKGQPMTFEKAREFTIDIYKDIHEAQSVRVMKSVQCGISEAFVISHLEQAERGLAIMYILPKGDIRNRFVNNRINRTLVKVPFYKEIISKAIMRMDSVMLKQFGEGVINYVASNSPANFTEFPADAIYYDEKDRMDQEIVLLAQDRVSNSDYKYERVVSNPTIEGYGISKDFNQSSQGWRYFKCDHCNHWQKWDFFQNVVRETDKRVYDILDKEYKRNEISTRDVYVFCAKCGKRIERFEVDQTWVHLFPNHENRGYQISKLFSPQGTIRQLVNRLVDTKDSEVEFQKFLNSDIGIPMVASGSQITESMIRSTCSEYTLAQKQEKKGIRYAGVDVGSHLHTVVREWVGGKKKLIWKGKLREEKQLLKLFADFGLSTMVIDALPETRMVENLKKESSLIYDCFYQRATKATKINKKERQVIVRRTNSLDRVMENYERHVYVNPKDICTDNEYVTHMESNVRVADASSGEFVWIQKHADHYFHAEGYADLAGEVAIGRDIWMAYNIENQPDEEKHNVFADITTPQQKGETLDELVARKEGYSPNDFYQELANKEMLDELGTMMQGVESDDLFPNG